MKSHESGYTLIGVLAIFTIASILAISLVTLSMNTLKASKTEVDNQAVFYIAEAGLNKAMSRLMSDEVTGAKDKKAFNNNLTDIIDKINTDNELVEFTEYNGDAPSVKVEIKANQNNN